ncbi:LytR/AlgR family response regulator transcription factor [Fuchsiella alkaliacetigena]|uniref:LytR/AlgR family response regulator transcription factor n=1 Tax=Fuchsiella alkaliacetigena TaxID=957042 RepID=UPI00200A456E|nr:response regulator [Fuchsiella alkaliacetigena]MCK8824045.1 response regulator [Fuchsiella alkaliacetigena]
MIFQITFRLICYTYYIQALKSPLVTLYKLGVRSEIMLNIVVVDDELHSSARIKEFISQVEELNLVGTYSNYDNCLSEIKENKISADVVFLDIEILGYSGLELAERILEVNEEIDIVFVTAYDSYAVEAFELNALDYLLKPLTKKRFQKTISRLLAR